MDCTPDVSHEEQLSIIIRVVDMDSNNEMTDVEIKEYFMDFINIQSTTGLNLSDILISKLKEYQTDLADCRGLVLSDTAKVLPYQQTFLAQLKDFTLCFLQLLEDRTYLQVTAIDGL